METPTRNLIGNGTVIKGDIESSGDIRIDGHLVGMVRSNGKVVVGQSGVIEGSLMCKSTDISGKVKGLIKAETLTTLKATAKVDAELYTRQLYIETGAVFSGKCVMEQLVSDKKKA